MGKLKEKSRIDKILLIIGLTLLIMEIWKQFYLYFVYYDHHYNVWYFPFQLCSTPMYLCIIRYFVNDKIRVKIDTYLKDYSMLGGVMALIVHDGFTYPDYPLLTAHGYLWHVLLITISVLIFINYHSQTSKFTQGLYVFIPACIIATILNVLLHPYGNADMFYISPYHISTQPVIKDIEKVIGILPGHLLYLAAVAFGAFIVHLIYELLQWYRYTKKSSDVK